MTPLPAGHLAGAPCGIRLIGSRSQLIERKTATHTRTDHTNPAAKAICAGRGRRGSMLEMTALAIHFAAGELLAVPQ
jgi:hypothetical protein